MMRKFVVFLATGLLLFTTFGVVHANNLTETQVSQLYVSIFGRASEGSGNAFWMNAPSMVEAAESMLDSSRAKAYFGNSLNTNQAFIEHIYLNTLGKTYLDDPKGINFWVGALDGGMSKGKIITSMIQAAQKTATAGAAQDRFNNKVAVSDYTATIIDKVPDVNDLSAFVGFISGVTDESATMTSAKDDVRTFGVDNPAVKKHPKFNYNEDGSSIRELSNKNVNNYLKTQESLLEKINGNDSGSFHNLFENYVNGLLEDSYLTDSIPSYAPRGESKEITINVANGQIDYSNYILKGDINLDSKVDFTDLNELKMALFTGSEESIYDLNSDNVIDTRDMIFLVARIGSEVSYFDFYTTAGEKISDIPTREASDPRAFSYTGTETQVMVVPKDINKASGFTSGLNDLDDVWYKKTDWTYQDDDGWVVEDGANGQDSDTWFRNASSASQDDGVLRRSAGQEAPAAEKGKGEIFKYILDKLLDFDKVKSTPYLVGWHLDLRYVNAGTFKALDNYGMDGSRSYMLPYENRIRNPHFAKTKMMYENISVTKTAYVFHLGIERDPVHVRSVRQPIKRKIIVDGQEIIVRQIVHAQSQTFTSNEEHTLSADIWSSNNNLEGNVKLYRIGPYPDEKDYGSAEVKNNSFSVPNLPYGAYKMDFENKCGCSTSIDDSYIFKDDDTYILEMEEVAKNVRVGLTIVDGSDNPLSTSTVTITSAECVSEAKSASGTTNGEGFVAFTDMPIGKYNVSVDGAGAGSITFCDNYNSTVVVAIDRLWEFSVTYNSPYGSGTITASDFRIDFDAETDPGGIKVYAIADSTCGGRLWGCGDFLILSDNIVRPGSKWVSFSSMITIEKEAREMISGEIDYGMNGLVCDGHLPAGFNADSGATTWTYSNGFSSWTMTLTPCDAGGCD